MLKNLNMKKIIFTALMGIGMVWSASAQMKVVSTGDILMKNTGITSTTADLDIPVHNSDRNNFQAGSYGIQSLGALNGFLTHNSFHDAAHGGGKMVLRTTGAGAMAQFFNGRIIYRTMPYASAGSAVSFTDALVIQNIDNGANVQIGFPWTSPKSDKLAVNGTVGATAFNVIASDRRLKENFSDFKYGLKEVLQLKPVNFNYNGKIGINDNSTHVGLIAQELMELVPQLVHEFKHKEVDVQSDIGGKMREKNEKTYYTIRDNEVKYLLINAIKEQQKQIESQEQRINDLEELIKSQFNQGINSQSIKISSSSISKKSELNQNIPNPFINNTSISYKLPKNSQRASLNIYGIGGTIIKEIDLDTSNKEGQVNLNTIELGPGTYLYQLIIDGVHSESRRMIKN